MFDIKIEGKKGLGVRPPNPRTRLVRPPNPRTRLVRPPDPHTRLVRPPNPRTWLANSRSNVHCTATLALDVGREGRW